jgi:hypothetical protein
MVKIMSGFIDFVINRVSLTVINSQISGAILSQLKKTESEGRPDYFYLKDLVNPQQVYWDHVGAKPAIPPELKSILDFGTMMHERAGLIFSKIPGFSDSGGKIDGADVEIPGIVGRIDFRLKDSIIEFKTTGKNVSTSEEVWKNVPQDLEQLLFYGSIWTHMPDYHYLVFYTHKKEIIVYQIKITKIGDIRNTMKQRRDGLIKAIKTSEPKYLKRCRYFDGLCPAKNASLCSCHELLQINTSPLENAAIIKRSPEMEKIMQDAWQSAAGNPLEILRPWDLETPRLAYGILKGEIIKEPWFPSDDEQSIWNSITESGLLPNAFEMPARPRLIEPLGFTVGGTFLIRRISEGSKKEGFKSKTIYTPTIIRNWNNDYLPKIGYKALRTPIMNLGVLCAFSEQQTGFIILNMPKNDSRVMTYELKFKDLSEIRKDINRRLKQLKKAMDTDNPNILADCPDYVKEKRCSSCKMQCHHKE